MDKNVLTLNGKRYDAITGKLIGPAAPSKPHHAAVPAHKPAPAANADARAARLQQAHAVAIAKTPPKPNRSRSHHGQPKAIPAHKPEHAKTLMRRAVRKPVPAKTTPIKQHYPIALKSPDLAVPRKLSAAAIDSNRQKRAEQIRTSEHVGRFRSAKQPAYGIQPRLQPVAVAAPPVHTAAAMPTHPTAAVRPGAAPDASLKTKEIFERALSSATSHMQPPHEPRKSKLSGFKNRHLSGSLAAVAAVLVIGGFVTYLNKSSVELQIASVRAGFKASMPAYAPEGYKKQPASSQDGKVAISFVSPVDNSGFTLTQEPSNWDSQTLFDTIVSQQTTTSYQTVQHNGRTIYIYDDADAAWVDGGMLYKVTGSAPLTSDQIISIATSL